MTRVAVIGNHRHTHCSEAQWARALEANGCAVARMQVEDVARDPHTAMSLLRTVHAVTYTRTHSRGMYLDESWCDRWQELEQAGVRTIGLHLDRFWGLEREHLVHTDAQFRVGTLWTADGGNDDAWRSASVNHEWLVPAADADDARTIGSFDPQYAHDVVFVGSGRYHVAYKERDDLIAFLHDKFGPRFAHYGAGGGRRVVRGDDLRRVYASSKVVIGDSCFANSPVDAAGHRASTAYWSDRVPISLSLGAFFIHPWVPRMREHFTVGRHYVSHVPGDWEDLDAQIGAYIGNEAERNAIAGQGRAHVLAKHTWTHRVGEILARSGLGVEQVA